MPVGYSIAANRNRSPRRVRLITAACWLVGFVTYAIIVYAVPPDRDVAQDDANGPPIVLSDDAVTESSGLAFSRRDPTCVWTHNDSGGSAIVFAFDRQGHPTGRASLDGLDKPTDWEDMAAFVDDGKPMLLVADCGDNWGRRKHITLHFIHEPDPRQNTTLRPALTLQLTYPDDRRDCEAIAVDMRSREVFLFTKSLLPACGVYTVAIPPIPSADEAPVNQTATATRRMTLTIPLVTGADIDPTNGDLMLVGYFQAYRYRRQDESETTESMLRRLPEPVTVPRLKQIEAVAVDERGVSWVTSEGKPAPMQPLETHTK